MKKFILKTSALFIGVISINLLFFIVLSSGKKFLQNENTLNSFLDKSPQNIVFAVGGSSMRNSFDSELVSTELQKEVYNTSFSFAHNAGFVLNYMTDKVKEGDIIVFGPEFVHYYSYNRPITISQMASVYNSPSLYKYLIENQKREFVFNVPRMNILFSYRLLKMNLYPNLFIEPNYSDRGDYMDHHKDKKSWNPSNKSKYERSNMRPESSSGFKQALIKANKKIHEKGASFFVTFPPYPISDYDTWITDDLLNFYKDTSIKLIGKPNSFVLNDTLFSNHPYHTTVEGRRLRSGIFSKLAKKELEIIK
tara:strand:- start:10993 stop:11916 length:924 start_codon:yes stop_codon:yes gene_type:complete